VPCAPTTNTQKPSPLSASAVHGSGVEQRAGDIAAMWRTISGVAAVTGTGWPGAAGERVGTFAVWMIVLADSAAVAPMIGEIGNTAGSVTSGAGNTAAVAIIAYSLLGLVGATAFAQLRALR
jgi:hypothetical protein